MARLLSPIRAALIGEWRQGWRFWSVRLQALAVTLGALLTMAPQILTEIWSALPPELKAMLPPHIARWTPIMIGVAAIVARFLKQEKRG